ncbi:hypothetical protein TRAPUB_7696 [Trametes pubescens]|uniref:Uncharacterized protein n=1 Tax=Trametes pubescens TaxID=154538 RepID=A0A1M2V2Q8_TRAPU|nr:hypothetical protein TRAPUB_7696 [Trametes pubescens]
MLLFGRSDAATKKPTGPVLADLQCREDERDLDHAIKDLASAEKAHDKSVKAAFDAHRAVDKAIENEYETAKALNRATHNHDVAISNEENTRITAKINQQYEVHLQQGLAEKSKRLDELQRRKAHNDQMRESNTPQPHLQPTVAGVPEEGRARSDSSDQHGCMGGTTPTLKAAAPAKTAISAEDVATVVWPHV